MKKERVSISKFRLNILLKMAKLSCDNCPYKENCPGWNECGNQLKSWILGHGRVKAKPKRIKIYRGFNTCTR